jgi:hypothetical protein
MSELKKSLITKEEEGRIEEHLAFIDTVSVTNLKLGYRTIIGGGYAVDGNLGEITRPHNDIDIHIYGKEVMTPVLLESICLDVLPSKHGKFDIEDNGRKEFYHSFFIKGIGADVYYIRLATAPFTDTKIVIKDDGEYAEEDYFETKMVYLRGVRFEAQNPVVELADKVFKRVFRGDPKLEKHEQDIYNLKLITDEYAVQDELDKMRKTMSR